VFDHLTWPPYDHGAHSFRRIHSPRPAPCSGCAWPPTRLWARHNTQAVHGLRGSHSTLGTPRLSAARQRAQTACKCVFVLRIPPQRLATGSPPPMAQLCLRARGDWHLLGTGCRSDCGAVAFPMQSLVGLRSHAETRLQLCRRVACAPFGSAVPATRLRNPRIEASGSTTSLAVLQTSSKLQ